MHDAMHDLNPQAAQMADDSMVRNLAAQIEDFLVLLVQRLAQREELLRAAAAHHGRGAGAAASAGQLPLQLGPALPELLDLGSLPLQLLAVLLQL